MLFITAKLSSSGSGMDVRIQCDKMDLASEVIQDMAKFMGVTELESVADFPEEMAAFELVVHQVEDYNASRVKLTADMADDSQHVKAYIVRAEDSRLLADMKTMRRAYAELFALNNQLVANYNLRAQNHEGLLVALKEVNQMIQRASNLRVGKAKSSLVADCRAAVKANNMSSLLRIIQAGYDTRSDKRAAAAK